MNTKFSKNRKLKRMFVNILSIVVILAMAFPVTGNAQAMSKPLSLEQDEAINVAESDLPLGISSQNEGPLNLTWLQVNADGFGDSQNQQVPSLAVFGEYLYAGVWHWDYISEISKAQIWRTADGNTWDQVNEIDANGAAALIVYNGYLYSGSWDGKVWRSQDGLDWEYIVNNGFDGNSNGIARFAVFNNTFYASTWGDGSQIWRTTNGTDWELFAEAGLGDPNNAGAIASEVFNGYLYWGVGNWVTGAQLWRTDGVSTEAVITDGFGSIDNGAISSLASFGGYLYAGLWNSQGIQIWRSSDGDQWEQTNWVGAPTGQPTSALEVYENQLYLVTGNDATGLEVWRTATGDAWEQIATNGFGDANNQWSYWDNATTVFGGKLYVATNNFASGGEVWQLSMLPPSTFIVNTTDDNKYDGTCDEVHCSLREALNTSNARIVPDTIIFNIPGTAPYTIQPRFPLPNINDPVTIDGTTQPGYEGAPIIELDGTYAGEWANGLVIATNNSTVQGLVINRFGGEGLAIYGSGNVVQNNYFGTDVTGTTTTGSASGPEYGGYQLDIAVACSTYDPGTDRDGFISESGDALAPWSGTSVTFKGTNECGIPEPDTFEGASLIYRYKLVFDDPNTELTSIAVSGAAFNGGALRILDENMVVLGIAYNWGGNSFQTNYVRLFGVVGQVFYIEEYDFSSDWRYRQNIVINGILPLGNRGNGVLIAGGATDNTVSENLISGNRWNGVGIFNPGTTGNVVQENYIGTNVMGTQALGNGAAGVGIGGQAYNNYIIGNLISGNKFDGISIFNPGTNGNTLQGNNIGTDVNREVAIPNGGVGVWIGEGASNTVIGGNDASTRNVISGNKWGGVSINHLETIGTHVTGNYIGTNKNGDNALLNGGDGVYISGSQSIVSGNVISGNTASGVSMGWSATGNLVQNNYIGTDATGTTTSGTAGPTVGDYTLTVMPETCLIYPAGTDFDGFVSASEDPIKLWSGTSVSFKGTDECTGREMLGAASLIYRYKLEFSENTELTSIAVSGAAFNGPDNVLRLLDENMNVLGTVNTFGGNSFQTPIVELKNVTGKVFYVDEFDTSSTWRFRQSIVINGPLPLGNLGSGVNFHDGATHNQVIGNLISGNRSDAVSLYHTNTTGNILQGNYIGTDVTGTVALPNMSAAIWIGEGASNTLIGGTEEGQGNVISGNTGDAISINNSETTGTIIQGNFIGTDATGTASIPNQSNGIVLVTGTHDNLIGGIEPGAGNTIAFNKGTGILYADAGTGNAALSNSVFSNGWLGIELGGDGVTRNDRLDQDTGPNNLQNYPIVTAVKRFDTTVTIQGLLPSTPQTTFRVEFFRNDTCDSSGFGEGRVFIGFAVVKTNPAGVGRFDVTLPVSLPQGTFVTATATDPKGNTSEFSSCFTPAPGWNQVNDSGFGNPATNGVSALENFQGQLYAGASNWETGGQIWRLGQDGLWLQVNEAGFGMGVANPAIIDLVIFQNQLYASTGWGGTLGQVWRSANGANWQPVTIDGFGKAENSAVTSFAVFKNVLYAGTGGTSGSAQIWSSNTGKSGSWKQVAPDGPGLAGNITGFAIYKNILYAAVEPAGGLGAPIQVWRSVDGSAWTTVIPDGFWDGNNVSTGGFAQFGGYLYLGTRNDTTGAQLWRTNDGIHWVQVIGDGFGDSNNIKIESLVAYNNLLYAVTYNWAGLQVWRSADGLNWNQVSTDGFGDSANSATLWNSATVEYQGQLVIGTWNSNDGGEIWQFTP